MQEIFRVQNCRFELPERLGIYLIFLPRFREGHCFLRKSVERRRDDAIVLDVLGHLLTAP